MSRIYQNFVAGQWHAPINNAYLPNINPADETDILGEFPNSDTVDAQRAVDAAAQALPGWAALAAPSRGEFLRRAADILESRVAEIAADLTREEGKSLPEARGETLRGVAILRYFAAQTMLPEGETIPSFGASTFLYTRRIPLGVVALVTPWNFPIAIPLWKAAPALAFGNTVVLKPSELAPLTAWHTARAFEEAGLPSGVLNVLWGQGARVGETLTGHPAVSGISFTGSAATGRKIAAGAAANGKKYQLEMGGKNCVIVLPDADLEQAVNLTIQGAFKSAGEKCTATSRAIVHTEIYDRFAELLVQKTAALKLGPGTDPDAYLGPVITRAAQQRILAAVSSAKAAGCTLLCGGGTGGPHLEKGFYIEPTVFGDVLPDSSLAKEEIFGPVLALMRADSLDDALAKANSVEYGLSASLFTRDLNSALKFAERVEAGLVRINGETAGVEPQAPFGGMKASSSFSREQGLAAREFFTQIKTVSVDRAGA